MNIQCPNCGENLETPCEIGEGQHVLCPCCNAKFEYRAKQTFCPNCAQELVLPHGVDEGQHLKCPYCEKVFTYTSKADCKKRHERFPWGRLLVMSDFLWLSSIKRGAYGRCGRIEYALQLVKTLFWLCMLGMMCRSIAKNAIAVPLVVSVVGWWSLIFASIRRFHDWNKAGWWVLTLIPMSVVSGIVLSLLGLRVDSGTLNGGMLGSLWIAALCFPPVTENNRFGEAVEFQVPKPKVKHWVLFALITLIKVRILIAAVSSPCTHENAASCDSAITSNNVIETKSAKRRQYEKKSLKLSIDRIDLSKGLCSGFEWGSSQKDRTIYALNGQLGWDEVQINYDREGKGLCGFVLIRKGLLECEIGEFIKKNCLYMLRDARKTEFKTYHHPNVASVRGFVALPNEGNDYEMVVLLEGCAVVCGESSSRCDLKFTVMNEKISHFDAEQVFRGLGFSHLQKPDSQNVIRVCD